MKKTYTYIENKSIKEIVEWVNWLNTNLQYPNSENSNDERRYTEIFETEVLKLIGKNSWPDFVRTIVLYWQFLVFVYNVIF